MKKKLYLLLFILFPFVLVAQVATLTQFEQIKNKIRSTRIKIFANEEGDIVVQPYLPGFLRYRVEYESNLNKGDLSLYHFNKNFKLTGQNIYKFDKSDYSLNQTFKFGNKIVALLDWYDNSSDAYHLAYTLINGSNISSQKPITLCAFPVEKKRQRKINVLVSEDNKHFALVNSIDEKNEDPNISCAVFDQDFQIVWQSKSLPVKLKYTQTFLEDIILGNDEQIYANFESYNTEKKSIVQFESSIFIINSDGLEKEHVNFEKFIPVNSKLNQKGNNIMLTGFYLLPDKSGFQGLYDIVLDAKAKSFSEINQFQFTQKFLNEANFKNDSKSKKPLELTNLKIKFIADQTDESKIVFFEESIIIIRTTYGSHGSSKTDYLYYDNCIFYSRINKSGEIEWTKLIPKRQISKNSSGCVNSFALHQGSDGIYLFFNDNKDNLAVTNVEKIKPTSNGKKVEICVVKIDPVKGEYSKDDLLSNGAPKLAFFRELESISPNNVAFIGMKGRKKYLCSVSIK